MGDAKFKLEDILNKQKAQPQILDLTNVKIESEEDFKGVIEKIPDYKIKPERVGYQFHSNKVLFPSWILCLYKDIADLSFEIYLSQKKRLSR